ncbi:hypothetical protein TGFOU_406000 [Toxoplasma gondii FOU]|uniref:Uncharacterized protein n=1 Tax=Toxoplasma gondii FOU TaxID=943167 RepID=A0A086JXN4_TOXGO|nr:hypothetical protein TGFOU_406000 [Toxoplasma gondii FOU]
MSPSQAFAVELQSRDKQMVDLTKQLAESQQAAEKSRHDSEVQLETIEAKVKQALWAKDETIRELREEMAALETKVEHFRDMLRKQREELLAPCQISTEEETTHVALPEGACESSESQPPLCVKNLKSSSALQDKSRRPRKTGRPMRR